LEYDKTLFIKLILKTNIVIKALESNYSEYISIVEQEEVVYDYRDSIRNIGIVYVLFLPLLHENASVTNKVKQMIKLLCMEIDNLRKSCFTIINEKDLKKYEIERMQIIIRAASHYINWEINKNKNLKLYCKNKDINEYIINSIPSKKLY